MMIGRVLIVINLLKRTFSVELEEIKIVAWGNHRVVRECLRYGLEKDISSLAIPKASDSRQNLLDFF